MCRNAQGLSFVSTLVFSTDVPADSVDFSCMFTLYASQEQ